VPNRSEPKVFDLVLIKPTHYHDDGYPIRWLRAAIPTNVLASLYSLAEDARRREVLGPGVEIRLQAYDDTNQRVQPERVIRRLRRSGGRALIAFVGVQSNQFPRAMDLARPFRAAGLPVAIGGFHVSGCLAMLQETPPELVEAQRLGISFFAGEAEGRRLDRVLRDAWNGALEPVYNFMDDLPSLEGEPLPLLPRRNVRRIVHSYSSFDLGRGCPYQCSFCTIINVQGRKSRFRTPDDLEQAVRANWARGIRRFFITDDNLARNRNWEALFDRMIRLRQQDRIKLNLMIQVDTLCHRIPSFIEKAAEAGVRRVFIGLENINPDNLLASKKHQNKITEYRVMLQKWREHGMITYAGYITGFPADTKQSILRDIEIIKRELPLDLLELFYLTPLPGSEDHRNLLREGVWMDPDLNKYDLSHRVTHHPRMTDAEWDEVYRAAWESFYSDEHLRTILRRAAANPRGRPRTIVTALLWFKLAVLCEGVHPLEGGIFRKKARTDRRPELPREPVLAFYPRRAAETAAKMARYWSVFRRMQRILKETMAAPDRWDYRDIAVLPPETDEFERLDLYRETRGAAAAVARKRRDDRLRARAG
jgi:hypothetical protein